MVKPLAAAEEVALAKHRLRAIGARPGYISKIRDNPVASAGVALAAGALLQRVFKGHMPPSLVSLAFHLLRRF